MAGLTDFEEKIMPHCQSNGDGCGFFIKTVSAGPGVDPGFLKGEVLTKGSSRKVWANADSCGHLWPLDHSKGAKCVFFIVQSVDIILIFLLRKCPF